MPSKDIAFAFPERTFIGKGTSVGEVLQRRCSSLFAKNVCIVDIHVLCQKCRRKVYKLEKNGSVENNQCQLFLMKNWKNSIIWPYSSCRATFQYRLNFLNFILHFLHRWHFSKLNASFQKKPNVKGPIYVHKRD